MCVSLYLLDTEYQASDADSSLHHVCVVGRWQQGTLRQLDLKSCLRAQAEMHSGESEGGLLEFFHVCAASQGVFLLHVYFWHMCVVMQ